MWLHPRRDLNHEVTFAPEHRQDEGVFWDRSILLHCHGVGQWRWASWTPSQIVFYRTPSRNHDAPNPISHWVHVGIRRRSPRSQTREHIDPKEREVRRIREHQNHRLRILKGSATWWAYSGSMRHTCLRSTWSAPQARLRQASWHLVRRMHIVSNCVRWNLV